MTSSDSDPGRRTLLVFADSLAYYGPTGGLPADHPRIWPNLVAAELGWDLELIGRIGWTCRDVWWAATQDPRAWAALPRAGAVVFATGGIGDWFAEFLHRVRGMDLEEAALAIGSLVAAPLPLAALLHPHRTPAPPREVAHDVPDELRGREDLHLDVWLQEDGRGDMTLRYRGRRLGEAGAGRGRGLGEGAEGEQQAEHGEPAYARIDAGEPGLLQAVLDEGLAQPVLIGRADDSTLVLDDDYASTRHARISMQGDEWYVEDLGSTNGTYLGNVRIHRNSPVAPSISAAPSGGSRWTTWPWSWADWAARASSARPVARHTSRLRLRTLHLPRRRRAGARAVVRVGP